MDGRQHVDSRNPYVGVSPSVEQPHKNQVLILRNFKFSETTVSLIVLLIMSLRMHYMEKSDNNIL